MLPDRVKIRTMKNVLRLFAKCLVNFLLCELCITIVFCAVGFADNDSFSFGIIAGSLLASIPMAVLLSSFLTFFSLNSVLSSRLKGYAILLLFNSIIVTASLFVCGNINRDGVLSLAKKLPEVYSAMPLWFADTSMLAYMELIPAAIAFAFFVSSFWGCTRLSRSRPLMGAFAAPGCIFLNLGLFNVYQSAPAMAVFSYLQLSIPRTYTIAIFTGFSALIMMLLDILFARKPLGGGRNA